MMFPNFTENKNPEQRLFKNTVFLYVMQISGYVFPLLTFPYLTRVLGPEKYGIIVFSSAVMSYFQLAIDFGFLHSATKSCSQYTANSYMLSHVTIGVIQSKIILAIFWFVILLFICHIVPAFSANKIYFLLAYAAVALTAFLPDFLFRGIEQMETITYRVVLSKSIYCALIFFLIHSSDNYLYVPVCAFCTNGIAVIFTWFHIGLKKIIVYHRVTLTDTMKYLRESSLFFMARIANTAYQGLNTVFLGFRFSSPELAQFGAANSLVLNCRSVFFPVSTSIYPYMIKNKNYKLIKKIILIAEPVIITACIVMFVFAEKLILFICGEKYEGAVPVFRCMIPLIVVTLPANLLGYPVLGAMGKLRAVNISILIGALFHISALSIAGISGILSFRFTAQLSFCTELFVLAIQLVFIFFISRQMKNEGKFKT